MGSVPVNFTSEKDSEGWVGPMQKGCGLAMTFTRQGLVFSAPSSLGKVSGEGLKSSNCLYSFSLWMEPWDRSTGKVGLGGCQALPSQAEVSKASLLQHSEEVLGPRERLRLPNQLLFVCLFAFKPAPFVIVCCPRPGTPRQISRSVGGQGSV